MAKLKLGAIADDKPVKMTVELSAALHRDLKAMPRRSAASKARRSVIQ